MTANGKCEVCQAIAHRFTYREDIKGWYCETHWGPVFNESVKNETSADLVKKADPQQITQGGILLNRKQRKILEAQARKNK